MAPRPGEVTRVLLAIADGDGASVERLFPLVYDELRSLACDRMAGERRDHTLQPTAVVNEVYLRLVGDENPAWSSRRYFFAAAGEAMRRVLVEHARSRKRQKRGGGRERTPLEQVDLAIDTDSFDWLALDEALKTLEADDERVAEVVRLRFFAGLGVEETAAALEISERTVKRDWRYAKAFLYRAMSGDSLDESSGA